MPSSNTANPILTCKSHGLIYGFIHGYIVFAPNHSIAVSHERRTELCADIVVALATLGDFLATGGDLPYKILGNRVYSFDEMTLGSYLCY